MDKIIFITPFFERTGSEVALLNLIKHWKNSDIVVISRKKGVLRKELSNGAFYDYQTYLSKLKTRTIFDRLVTRIRRTNPFSFDSFIDSVIGDGGNALFYVNTIIMPEVTEYLLQRKYKFVLHVHELPPLFIHLNKNNLMNMVLGADYVFCSSQTCQRAIMDLGRTDNITVSHPGIDIKKVGELAPKKGIKKKLDIPEDAFLLLSSGTLDPNKNPEAFFEVGETLLSKGYKIHLVWIGAYGENGYRYYIEQRVNRNDTLKNHATIISRIEDDNYFDYIAMADCFLLTSYSESFSLVTVEALALGKPVVSFNSGGPEEIITNDLIGTIVKGHDSEAMALAVEKVINGEAHFSSAKAKARAVEFSDVAVAKSWSDVLQRQFNFSML